MKTIKIFLGVFPLVFFLVIKIGLSITEKSFDIVLRDIPECILLWLFILSILILIIYVITKFFSLEKIRKLKYSKIAKNVSVLLYCIGILGTLYCTTLYSAFTYGPEEVVVENGVKMLARDTSYLDYGREYYKYENTFFRGKQILIEIRNKTYWIYDYNGELIEMGERD